MGYDSVCFIPELTNNSGRQSNLLLYHKIRTKDKSDRDGINILRDLKSSFCKYIQLKTKNHLTFIDEKSTLHMEVENGRSSDSHSYNS